MKTVLQDVPCYVGGDLDVIEGKRKKKMRRPRLPVIENLSLSFLYEPATTVEVRAMVDTGNDITIVRREKIWELERILQIDIMERRKILYYDMNDRELHHPAFPLALCFTGNDCYHSKFGFISPKLGSWNFDEFDVWIGQDILNQLVCTFNGVKGTVTIIQP